MESFIGDAFQTGHVGLNVTDVARSERFYQNVFGFQTMLSSAEAGRQFAFLGDGKKLILTLWQQSSGSFYKNMPGLHHLSFQVISIEEVKAFELRLRALGVPLLYDRIVPHGEGIDSGGVFFLDPDGIRLEVYTLAGAGAGPSPTPGAPSCGFF
jgi:catechol 2,3-dioxygenase-like lactoylglutathione lyase family enzyme